MIFNKKGQRAIAGLLYWFMALVSVALLMPQLRASVSDGLSLIPHNFTNYTLIAMIITYWPVYLGIMLLIILVIVIK